MRAALLLVAAVLVAACTPAASAPVQVPSSALTSGSAPAPAVTPSAGAATTPATTPATTSASASATGAAPASGRPSSAPTTPLTPSGATGLLAASPAAAGPPLPPNPFELGGPAPVGSFVLGDSISLSAGVGPVLARLGYPVMGVIGQSASDTFLRTHLASATAQLAPAWVIALGTNNTADPADVARLAGWVATIDSLRSPLDRQKVYWVTPHRPTSYVGSKSRWTMDAFNAELTRLDARHGWLRIIDYDAVARAHPEWFDQDTAMHLHPDARGQGVLVALIAGPDAVPVRIPAPLFTGPATPSPEPPTFVNSPRQPSSPQEATPSPAPVSPAPLPTPAPTEPAAPTTTPVPLDSATAPPTAPAAPEGDAASPTAG